MEHKNPVSNWAAVILALLSAYWGYISYSPPLNSSRPDKTGAEMTSLIGHQTVPARLWQDPFDAVERVVDGTNEAPKAATCAGCCTGPKEETKDASLVELPVEVRTNAQIIGVFLEGQNYPEDVEVRLRLRYAVQAGFADERFQPADRNFLGYLQLDWPRHMSATGSDNASETKTARLLVPYEVFTRDETNNVVVLWLKEEAFADHFLERFARLVELTKIDPAKTKSFALVGPRSSDTLRHVVDKGQPCPALKHLLSVSHLTIVSCEATGPDALLFPNEPGNQFQQFGKMSRPFLPSALTNEFGTNLEFINLIHTDDQLAALLARELEIRGVKLSREPGKGDKVVLVTESDTSYGRALLTTFHAAIEVNGNQKIMGTSLRFVRAHPAFNTNRIIAFTYLRGMDGSRAMATDDEAVKAKYAHSEEDEKPKPKTEPDRAEGEGQRDYARRLAAALKQEDQSHRHDGDGRIAAIGILGSDVYDKLILLQALRDQFPNAVFFTTDLDERFISRTSDKWVRNLVVASSHDVNEAPMKLPFRDAYQSSVYNACRAALNPPYAQELAQKTRHSLPHLYEIGRTRAVELPPADESKIFEGGMALGLSLLGIGFFAAGRKFRRVGFVYHNVLDHALRVKRKHWSHAGDAEKAELIHQKWKWLLITTLLTALCIVHVYYVAKVTSRTAGGEPFLWFEGVSVWPTELIRVICSGLSIWCLVWAWWSYRIRLIETKYEHEFTAKIVERPVTSELLHPSNHEYARGWARWKELAAHYRDRISITRWPRYGPHPEIDRKAYDGDDRPLVNVDHMFQHYQLLGRFRHRWSRVLPTAFGLSILCVGLLVIFDDLPVPRPARGDFSREMDTFLLATSVACFVVLMSYVMDITRLTERIINRLSSGKSKWPRKYIEKWRQKTGLDETELRGFLDVRFVAEHTAHVNVVVYWPFVVLCLMFIGRSQYFDRWSWPRGLQCIFLLNFFIAFICAVFIRHSANVVREDAVDELERACVSSHSADHRARLQALLKQVKEMDKGAYASWMHDPSIIGILLPTGGAGLFVLIKSSLGF